MSFGQLERQLSRGIEQNVAFLEGMNIDSRFELLLRFLECETSCSIFTHAPDTPQIPDFVPPTPIFFLATSRHFDACVASSDSTANCFIGKAELSIVDAVSYLADVNVEIIDC